MSCQRIPRVIAAAAAGVGLLAGCAGTSTSRAPSPPAGSTARGHQPYNQADVAFVQEMIPDQAQAVAMAGLASSRAISPQVKALAARIQAAQSQDIQQMSSLLAGWGAAAPDIAETTTGVPGGPAPMSGMLSTAQMQQLTSARGTAFDRMFLLLMISHRQGAVSMSVTELDQATNPATRQLAQQIITEGQAEVSGMQALLAHPGTGSRQPHRGDGPAAADPGTRVRRD